MLVSTIHGPVNLTTVKTAKGNLVHLFGDYHPTLFDRTREDYITNIIKKIPVDRKVVFFYEEGFASVTIFHPRIKFQTDEFIDFPNITSLCFDARQRMTSGNMPRKLSLVERYFVGTGERKIANWPKATKLVALVRAIFIRTSSLQKLIRTCTKLANLLMELQPSNKTTISVDDILSFANIIYTTFQTAASPLSAWFCDLMKHKLKTAAHFARKLKQQYLKFHRGTLNYYETRFFSMIVPMALFCDFVTLCYFMQLEQFDTTYIFFYGSAHTRHMRHFFTKVEHYKTIQSIPSKRPIDAPTVEFRERRAKRAKTCNPISAIKDQPEIIMI